MRKPMTYITTALVLILSLITLGGFTSASAPVEAVEISIKASPDSVLETKLEITNVNWYNALSKSPLPTNGASLPVSDAFVALPGKGLTYVLNRDGVLYDTRSHGMVRISPPLRKELLLTVERLRGLHYGQLVHWDQAKAFVPMKSVFTIIDMETGLTFRAQRRAGRDHADVQPLTAKDTAVMKQIYEGKWSWSRKAILVRTGKRTIAASMHGMPHGGDGIPYNKFSGHFCIHFLGSSTHRSDHTDPEHQLMVHKAAGKLKTYIQGATPLELVDAYISAFNLKEGPALRMMYRDPADPQIQSVLARNDRIVKATRHWSRDDTGKDVQTLLNWEVPVEIWKYTSEGEKQKLMLRFQLSRTSISDPWSIETIVE
jgi:hypothetical protein